MEEKNNNMNEETFVLTEDKIREYARAYVPIAEKRKFVDDVSIYCFDILNVSAGEGEALPPLYKENQARKVKYMTAALVKLYLGETFTPEGESDPWMMSDEVYDYISSGRPLSQLERVRRSTKDKELQAKCFDLVQDFKDLRDMLNSECHGLLHAMNDALTRFRQMLDAETTPEYVASVVQSLGDVQNELTEYMAAKSKTTAQTGG